MCMCGCVSVFVDLMHFVFEHLMGVSQIMLIKVNHLKRYVIKTLLL